MARIQPDVWMGQRIRARRIQLGLTPKDLGQLIGRSHYSVWLYEHGQSYSRNRILERLRRALKLNDDMTAYAGTPVFTDEMVPELLGSRGPGWANKRKVVVIPPPVKVKVVKPRNKRVLDLSIPENHGRTLASYIQGCKCELCLDYRDRVSGRIKNVPRREPT